VSSRTLVAEPCGAATDPDKAAATSTATIGVLVVDDDFRVAEVHRAHVDRVRPFRVLGVAGSGEEAVRAVDALRPGLVLLGLYLPDVDRVLAGAAPPAPVAGTLTKGMSVATAELVEGALRDADGTLSAGECAALTGLSRVSARHYLEHFRTTGSAEVSLRCGVAGRPERRYGWRG